MKRYFRVTCKHGHVGARKYLPITFVFLARDAIKAMDMAKSMPGVKHTAPILRCDEISYDEYLKYRKQSAYRHMEGV